MATVIICDSTGAQVSTVDVDLPVYTPSAIDQLASLDPPMAEAVLAAAAGFVNRAGDLWDAFVAMPSEDPAADAVGIVTDIALTAALPLTDP